MKRVLYIFGKLADADVEWLVARGRALELAPGQALITQGSAVDALYLVLDGTLAVRAGDREIATLGCGEVVGELSFLDARPPSATVLATTPAVVLAVSKAELKEKLADDSEFAARFYHALGVFLATRLRSAIGRLGFGVASPDDEAQDELDPGLLEDVDLAGARFDWLLKRVQRG